MSGRTMNVRELSRGMNVEILSLDFPFGFGMVFPRMLAFNGKMKASGEAIPTD